ncbi:MAG: hypothetical protein ACREJ9_03345 [Candidatus Rokuibacteriota bacterium]
MIGQAALGIWFDVDPSDDAELSRWYPRQHLPERLSVPGFLRGRRYTAAEAGSRYFTLYETVDTSVLSSTAYLERLNNPTDWTRRVLPTFHRMVRNAYRRLDAGTGDRVEHHLLTVRVKPAAGRGPVVRQWLEREAVGALAPLPGVQDSGLYMSDTGGTSVVTEERKLVGDVETAPPFLALLEIADPRAAPAVQAFWQDWARKIAADVTVDLYRLIHGLAWLSP